MHTGTTITDLICTVERAEEKQVIDELTYRAYAYNREFFPNTSPDEWAKILKNVPAMEARYQESKRIFERVEREQRYMESER